MKWAALTVGAVLALLLWQAQESSPPSRVAAPEYHCGAVLTARGQASTFPRLSRLVPTVGSSACLDAAETEEASEGQEGRHARPSVRIALPQGCSCGQLSPSVARTAAPQFDPKRSPALLI